MINLRQASNTPAFRHIFLYSFVFLIIAVFLWLAAFFHLFSFWNVDRYIKYITPVITSFIGSLIFVIIGLPYIQQRIISQITRRFNSELLLFWDFNYGNDINVIYGSQEFSEDNKNYRLITTDTSQAYSDIQGMVNFTLQQNTSLNMFDYTYPEKTNTSKPFEQDSIILGGTLSLPSILNGLFSVVDKSYKQIISEDKYDRTIVGSSTFVSKYKGEKLSEDHALITRVVLNNDVKRLVVVISGNHGLSTRTAVSMLTNASLLRRFGSILHASKSFTQFVITIRETNDNKIEWDQVEVIKVCEYDLTVGEISKIRGIV